MSTGILLAPSRDVSQPLL